MTPIPAICEIGVSPAARRHDWRVAGEHDDLRIESVLGEQAGILSNPDRQMRAGDVAAQAAQRFVSPHCDNVLSPTKSWRIRRTFKERRYQVTITPRKVTDNLLLYRVEIGGLKGFEEAHHTWLAMR